MPSNVTSANQSDHDGTHLATEPKNDLRLEKPDTQIHIFYLVVKRP